MTRNAYRLLAASLVTALVLVGGGCADDDQASVDVSESGTSATEGGSGDESDGDVQAFCEAVEALDRTDGTTDSAIVLAAISELRTTAPSEIRDDVNESLDSLVVGNYPEAADPSMEEMSLEERQAAADRMVAYVEEHC